MANEELRRVRGVAFDVDGVMTDGTVYIGSEEHEFKRFSVHDGTAIVWCRRLGLEIALVSGRYSRATEVRAEELGIEAVYQGVRDKVAQLSAWAADRGLEMEEILYMGDDLIDLPVFDVVGVSVAPANADSLVRERASRVTGRAGGEGAVREAIDWLLSSTGRMDEARALYQEDLSTDD